MRFASAPWPERTFVSTRPSAKEAGKLKIDAMEGFGQRSRSFQYFTSFLKTSIRALLEFRYSSSYMAVIGTSAIAQLLTECIFWFALHTGFKESRGSTSFRFLFVPVVVLSTALDISLYPSLFLTSTALSLSNVSIFRVRSSCHSPQMASLP